MDNTQELKIELRNLQQEDYKDLRAVMVESYDGYEDEPWRSRDINILLEKFPEGQICICANEKVVGCALSIVVDYDKYTDNHTYEQVVDNYNFNTHDPNGDVLYGIEVFVHPDYRGMRLARRLYDARKEICESLNLRGILFGGRMVHYGEYADSLTPKEYIEKVKNNDIYDRVLNFQLSNDFHVRKVIRNYLKHDTSSKDYAALMEWNNIYYEETEKHINQTKSVVRIGLVQWQMRPTPSLKSMQEQIEFFIDSLLFF